MTHGDRTAGSPQLDTPLRSRERAAIDEAVRALLHIEDVVRRAAIRGREPSGIDMIVEDALARIAALVPEAVK